MHAVSYTHLDVYKRQSLGMTVALGPEPVAPVAPAPAAPQQTCADKDSDGDGVNDCNDKCPNSQPGQTIGPDGCPVPVLSLIHI